MSDVFILGAGASMPYGFPNGYELLQDLRKLNYSKELIYELYLTKNKNIETDLTIIGIKNKRDLFIDKWEKLINKSVILTIDQFLKNHSAHTDFYEFGKILIAYLILEYERKATLTTSKNTGNLDTIDWIQHFLTEIDKTDNWKQKLLNTTFISYNYDRLLEYFILQYLEIDKNLEKDEANEVLDKINIYHINGYIGKLSNIPFGNLKNYNFPDIAKSIKTVWDPSSESTIVNETKEKVINSQIIYIIGTSFIKDNFNAIGLTKETKVAEEKYIYGTGFGLSRYQIKRAVKMIGHDSARYEDISLYCIKDILAIDLIKDFYCE